MNWTRLLSKYPRTMLKDEKHLLVLALLAREGLSIQKEIAEKCEWPIEETNSIILTLHQNDLISFEGEHLQLTQTGQKLIDRFDLTDLLLKDFLNTLLCNEQEFDSLMIILREYRKETPTLFQNTLATIRIWQSLSKSLLDFDKLPSRKEEFNYCSRSLLYRDLRNYTTHQPKAIEISFKGLSRLLSSKKVDANYCCQQNLNRHNLGCKLLIILDDQVHCENKNDIRLNISEDTLELLSSFHENQCIKSPNRWFDDWDSSANNINKLNKFKKIRFSKWLEDKGSLNQNENVDQWISHNAMRFRAYWTVLNYSPTISSDLISLILNCNTIEEISESTSIPIIILKNIIEQLRNKCNILLDKKSGEHLSPLKKEEEVANNSSEQKK